MNEVWKKPPVSLQAYQDMVGKEIGVSSWHLVDQSRINLYADVIEDHQFIHIDPERAKNRDAVRHHGGAWLPDHVAAEHHVLRGDAGDRGHHDGRQLRLRQAALHFAG
jgi:acyl dehydratase